VWTTYYHTYPSFSSCVSFYVGHKVYKCRNMKPMKNHNLMAYLFLIFAIPTIFVHYFEMCSTFEFYQLIAQHDFLIQEGHSTNNINYDSWSPTKHLSVDFPINVGFVVGNSFIPSIIFSLSYSLITLSHNAYELYGNSKIVRCSLIYFIPKTIGKLASKSYQSHEISIH
jgi:hypothetical protein